MISELVPQVSFENEKGTRGYSTKEQFSHTQEFHAATRKSLGHLSI
jgi:hypothetical protein